MRLDDEDTRRWFCKKDRLIFLAKEGGWIQEESPTSKSSAGLAQPTSAKSYSAGIAINFLLPGAGVIYAGSKSGLIYPVIVVVFLFVAWPVAIVAVMVSYVHTVAAIREKNDKINRARSCISNTRPWEPPGRSPLQVSCGRFCVKCGFKITSKSIYCPRCGFRVAETDSEMPDSDRTRLYK